MVSDKKLKENIESTGSKVGASADINDSNKNILKDLYNLVKEKSDSLVHNDFRPVRKWKERRW